MDANTPKVAKNTVSFSLLEIVSSLASVWSTTLAKWANMGAGNKSAVGYKAGISNPKLHQYTTAPAMIPKADVLVMRPKMLVGLLGRVMALPNAKQKTT